MKNQFKLFTVSLTIFGTLAVWLLEILSGANALYQMEDNGTWVLVFGFFVFIGTFFLTHMYAVLWDNTFPHEEDDITGESL